MLHEHVIYRPLLSFILLLAVGGCTYVNRPLNAPRIAMEARRHNATRATLDIAAQLPDAPPAQTRAESDGYFIGIAISGGGLRSANFSAACLFQLQRLGLLEHVDCISSVSGGSLTAAYYCLHDDAAWNPGDVQRKLTHQFATDGWITLLMPWNLIALAVSDFDRSDILAGKFEKVLYTDPRSGKPLTFADLRADRPRLVMNATDLQSGKPFIFCDRTFDELNSDLARYPMAYAVTASAAIPVLLHQVTLRDFSTIFKQYRHLIDGSVNDNLGVKTLVDVYREQMNGPHRGLYRRGAIFIVIDARTEFSAKIGERGDTTVLDTLRLSTGLAATALVNRASTATLSEILLESSPDNVTAGKLRAQRDDLINQGYVRFENVDGRPVHVLHIALSRVAELKDLPSADFSQSINSIDTYFNIDPAQAYQLYQAAELLIGKKFAGPLRKIVDELNAPASAPGTRP